MATRYPTVKDFWFDGTWDASIKKNGWWTAHAEQMLKEMLPGVTINSRLRADDKGKRHFDSNGHLMGDYESGYERRLPDPVKDLKVTQWDWEACMTIPENQWGYHKDWSLSYVKTPIEVIDRIVHAVSMGGNMVVNFGPQADGDFRPEEKALATAIGKWMHRYGEAVYACDYAGFDKQKNYYIQNNASVNIQIPWVEGLSLRGNASYDVHFYNRRLFKKPIVLYSWDNIHEDSSGLSGAKRWIEEPELTREHSDQTDWMVNGLIDYNRTFGKHNIGITVGVEAQKKHKQYTDAYRKGFISDLNPELSLGSDEGQRNSGYSWKEARLNYFGRVSYNFMERYLFEFVWRADGSYRFPKDKRYGFFPGVSVAWRASEENWWKENIRFIDYFKLRASVSQTGNDALLDSNNNYDRSIQYLNTYGFTTYGSIFNGTEQKRLYPTRTPNPNITWEVGTTYNVGMDFKFLQNRLSVEADAFYHKRTHMLISRNASLPEITGITLPKENIGEMCNRGMEMLVSWNDRAGNVDYYASFNMTYAKNKILFWDETPGIPSYQESTGMPVGANLYYVADGIFHNQAEINSYPTWGEEQDKDGKPILDANGNKKTSAVPGDIRFRDVNGDGKIDADDRIRSDKTDEPRFVAGITLGASWKGWDIMALFQAGLGGQMYIQTWSGTIGNFLKRYYDERWTPENPDANGPRTYERENQYWVSPSNNSTYFLKNADYLRLKNVELGYTFNLDALKNVGFSKLRLYTNASNIFTIDGIKDADPEQRNKDLSSYPLRRVINFGVQATF